ncbi:MAG: hypothetical protein WA823_07330 [Candidatus Acidiferrales bacterium]
MSTSTRFGGQRRSHRVHIAITIVLRAKRRDQMIEEKTTTTVVNSAGGLVLTNLPLQQGQTLSVTNKNTAEQSVCRVVSVGVGEANRPPVGLAFLESAPKFWRMSFLPDNWDASEQKPPGEAQRVAPKSAAVTQMPGRK